jgi:hypothetical protein
MNVKHIFMAALLLVLCTTGFAKHNNDLTGTEYAKIILTSKNDLKLIDEAGGIIDNVLGDTAWVYLRPRLAPDLESRGMQIEWLPAERRESGSLDDYHNNDQIAAQFALWESQYPDLFHYESIGLTVQNRNMWVCKLSNGVSQDSGKIEVRYIGAIHGDESVGTENCLRFAEDLLTNWQVDPELSTLMNHYVIWMLPLLNPDGQAAMTRGNAHGIDLNRSFPDRIDDSLNTMAGREPELANIMNWTTQHNFIMSANFHGGVVVVNYPFDGSYSGQSVYTACPDDAFFIQASLAYSVTNLPMYNSTEFAHGITNGCAWYNINGGLQDWCYVWMGERNVTIELSTVKHPAASTLEGFWQDNRESMRHYLLQAQLGVRGAVTDSVTGLPLRANISLNGTSYLTYSDRQWGTYYRPLLPGSYTLIFSAPGYQSKIFTGVTVVGETPTILNVALAPAPRAQIATVPDSIHTAIQICDQMDVPLTINNAGDVALSWSAVEGYSDHQGYGSATGGGWRYLDSDQAGGPVYNWKDISTIGTAIAFTADDQNLGPFPIGFSFPFYGSTFTTYRVSANGWISFTSTSSGTNSYTNVFLPSASAIENVIAPWWDDLSPHRSGTVVRRWTNNADSLVVSFQNVQSYENNGLYNFEVILLSSGQITSQYASMGTNRLNSATIGLQNADHTRGVTVVNNATYIHNTMAISFCPHSMITVSPVSGVVQPHSNSQVTVQLISCCVPTAIVSGVLAISSNDPLVPLLTVPVTMNVSNVLPSPVTDLVIFASPDHVHLTWDATANATGYKIYLCTSALQNYTEGTLLTPVPITETSYIDEMTPNIGFYQVIAVR